MPAQPQTKKLLADRYALTSEIGRGGMGVVWGAEDTRLQRQVAIKEVSLPHELQGKDSDAVLARVMREARAAGRLSHPSAVTVFDVFEEDGTAYIVMELVDSPTLAALVASRGPLDERTVAEVGLQILGALERAHAAGIVHRDVKPDNVMVTEDGRAKLADFGIASLKGDPTITATGILLGSPSYMAPEQAQDAESGPAADLWALGATLYFAVEGVAPFDRGKPIPTLAAVVYDDPRPPQRARGLRAPIMDLLSKSPEDRPDVDTLRRALEAIARDVDARSTALAGAVRTAPAPLPGGDEAASDDVSAGSLWDREAAPGPRRSSFGAAAPGSRRALPLVAGAVVVAALVAGLVWFVAGRDDPADTARDRRRSNAERAQGTGAGAQGQGQEDPAQGTATETTESPDALPVEQDSSANVPGGWVTYTDPRDGWSISHPAGWEVTPGPHDPETSVDIREPGTGTYLRVDWGDTPGPSPQQAWLDYEPEFAAQHDDYQRVQLTPTTFEGYPASLWEYTYADGGTELHAVNLGFVTGEHGFALNFQTHAEDWDASSYLFEIFKASFQAPS
jgi:hypothetical protein